MIHSTPQSGKFIKLMRRMRPMLGNCPVDTETVVVGLLEKLWHLAITSAQRGDVGKLDDETIAEAVGWLGDASELIQLLVECEWLDQCPEHRLVIHNWDEHCPGFIKRNISRKGGFAARTAAPPLGGSSTDEITDPCKSVYTESVERVIKQPLNDSPDAVSDHLPVAERRLAPTPNLTKPNLTTQYGTNPADRRFENFWKVVHRKEGKAAARKAFDKAVKADAKTKDRSLDESAEFIAERMRVFARSQQARDEIRGTIHPATWLNRGSYEDDPRLWEGHSGAPPPERRKSKPTTPDQARFILIKTFGVDEARGWPPEKCLDEYRSRIVKNASA